MLLTLMAFPPLQSFTVQTQKHFRSELAAMRIQPVALAGSDSRLHLHGIPPFDQISLTKPY